MTKRLIFLAVLLYATMALAQTTSSPSLPVINCPDVEAIIASVPRDLLPKPGLKGQALIDQGTKFKKWAEANAKGRVVDFSVVIPAKIQGSPIPASEWISEKDKNVQVQMTLASKSPAIVDGFVCINNSGVLTFGVTLKSKP